MLHIEAKIHDQYTLELKVGYSHENQRFLVSDFIMNTWIFIPDALYITPKTYTKDDFYRNIRSYVRLMTPIYSLHELLDEDNLPFQLLRESLQQQPTANDIKEVEHQSKMLANIIRSALRTRTRVLQQERQEERFLSLLEETLRDCQQILQRFRSMIPPKGDALQTAMAGCMHQADQYIGTTLVHYLGRLQSPIQKKRLQTNHKACHLLAAFFDKEIRYQQTQGFLHPAPHNPLHNSRYLKQVGFLRRYVESDLYLMAEKRSNTFMLQQILFMLAAGMSMIFATIVSFSFQQTYGNFTRPLFIALVVSYMFKDRIKDLLRFWFANKLGSKFYDYKTRLNLRGKYIGLGKEGFDHVTQERIPKEVLQLRKEAMEMEAKLVEIPESILLYRRRMMILGKRLSNVSRHAYPGVNEIWRINLKDFLHRMDNPHVQSKTYQGHGQFQTVEIEKLYQLNLIIQFSYQGHVYYKRYRLTLNRDGLKTVREW